MRYGGNITRQAVPGMLLMAGGNGGVMPTSQDQYHAILLLNPAEDAEPFKRDVRLTPAAMTFVEISDTDGKPLGGSTVYGARGPYDVRPKSITGSSLKFRTPSGEQKQYLVIWHKEKKLAGQTVAVSSTKKLTLRLQPCGSVTGQIVDGDEVVSEMPIGTLSAPGTDRSGWYPGTIPTDEEGRFRLDHLVPGFEYDLRTYDDPRVQIRFTVKPGQTLDLGRIDLKQVDVTAGAASADADVVEEAEQKTVTIRGRVEQQDGSPLGGAGIAGPRFRMPQVGLLMRFPQRRSVKRRRGRSQSSLRLSVTSPWRTDSLTRRFTRN